MLHISSIVNASNFSYFCSIGKRETLKNVRRAQNIILRTHSTSKIRNTITSVLSTNTPPHELKQIAYRNYIWLRASCVKEIHTQTMPQYQAVKTDKMNNLDVKMVMEDEQEVIKVKKNEMRENSETRDEQLISRLGKQNTSHSDILKEFPVPNSSLHNVYSTVETQLKIDRPLSMRYQKSGLMWTCKCNVKWPEDKEFIAKERSKSLAASTVALQCLHWLKDIDKIKNGLPVVFDVKKLQSSLNKPTKINIEWEMLKKVQNLLKKYESTIKPILAQAEIPKIEDITGNVDSDISRGDSLPSVKQRHMISRLELNPDERNMDLQKRLDKRQPVNYTLPITSYKNEILKKINKNQILLIKGDTGCGKTTQVPQIIMDSFAKNGQASKCNMIVTQPRRISAITLAERVAFERGEKIGDVVGYKVKLKQYLPLSPGAILFCTSGVLLKKMENNPNLIGVSHVIIDEAHERNVDIDMLLVLIKRAVSKNKDVKIIIMSASLNAELFQNYLNCESLEIPGKAYSVKMHFLEDFARAIGMKRHDSEYQTPRYPIVECDKIAELVQWISNNKPPGAILCFLPGWNEITRVETGLKELNSGRTKQVVYLIHSLMPHYDQQKIFEKPPPGVRKIILATDIAETGITVPDVVYVVDSVTHKQIRWDDEKQVNTMKSYWVSKANIQQRKGRAGRVQPGESYHFIKRSEYETLPPYALPEIKCLSLERVALDCKLFSQERIEDFLANMPEPPDPHIVHSCVNSLVKLGALDHNENLTTLGRKIAAFTLSPILGKIVLYSSIFNCVHPMLTLATMFSMQIEIFRNALLRKDEIRSVKQRFSNSSDHLALSWIYMQWEAFYKKNPQIAEKFCDETGLNPLRMLTLKKLRSQYEGQLSECLGMRQSLHGKPELNYYVQSDEMVRAVILAGVDQIIRYKGFQKVREHVKLSLKALADENNKDTCTTPESVNHLREVYPSPYLTYIRKTFSFERRRTVIRDSSLISPLTVMLFSQGKIFGYENPKHAINPYESNGEKEIVIKISDKDNVALVCSERTASVLFEFRDSIWAVVRYLIDHQGISFNSDSEQVDIVENYKNEMLVVLDEILTAAAKPIDTSKKRFANRKSEVDPLRC